jgi:hypothetical protein
LRCRCESEPGPVFVSLFGRIVDENRAKTARFMIDARGGPYVLNRSSVAPAKNHAPQK